MLETIKDVGSIVGLLTGIFVVFDRLLRHRPMASFRPSKDGDVDTMELVVHNTANEPIVVEAVECHPHAMSISYRDDWYDILDPDLKDGIAIIAPNSQKTFTCIPRTEWEKQKPTDKVRVVIRWSFTSLRWLPCWPLSRTNTIQRFDQIRTAVPPTA